MARLAVLIFFSIFFVTLYSFFKGRKLGFGRGGDGKTAAANPIVFWFYRFRYLIFSIYFLGFMAFGHFAPKDIGQDCKEYVLADDAYNEWVGSDISQLQDGKTSVIVNYMDRNPLLQVSGYCHIWKTQCLYQDSKRLSVQKIEASALSPSRKCY